MSDDVLVAAEDGIATVTLNRPASLNAMTPGLMGALKTTMLALDRDPEIRVVVITGAGRGFSAGGDRDFLEGLTRMSPVEIKQTVYENFQGAVKAIKLFSKPTIAAVNGPAVGAGCEVAVACDFRVASTKASFVESWIHLGVIAPLGGMFLLPRLIGVGRANEMLMLGKPVAGEEAVRIGLASEVATPEDLLESAYRMARQLRAAPPLALRAYKEGIQRGLETSLEAVWETGVYAQSMLINSADFAEAVKAVGEKRPPVFKGC